MDLQKIPLYSLPKLYGWHLLPRQRIPTKGKVHKYFGANWWDLLLNNMLPTHTGTITIPGKKYSNIILVNLGTDYTRLTNTETGDVYAIAPGKRNSVNNLTSSITLKSDNSKNEMYLTKIGAVGLLLLNVQDLVTGKSSIKNTDIFTDFLLMNGVVDKDQYLNTVGLESMDAVITQGWTYIDTEQKAKSDFTDDLLEHWKSVNPGKRSYSKGQIPKAINWIWVRKDIREDSYGALDPKFYKFMRSWIDRNPGFKYNMWTDNPNFNVPEEFKGIITIRGPEDIKKILAKLPKEVRSSITYLYKNHINPAVRSDVLRQVILYYEGGVYADVNDGLCLAPLEKMLEKFDYIIGMEPVMYVNNAILASKKRHPITQAMLAWLAHISKDFVEEWESDYLDAEAEDRDDYIVNMSGPIALTYVIFGLLESGKKLDSTLILPASWVYPNYWIPESPENWLKPMSIFAHYDGRTFL
jgi:hypothetical protein